MNSNFEAYWECFSDQLSFTLDDIAASEHLSQETVDKLHYAAVRIFLEQLDSILRNRAQTVAEMGSLTLQ